MCMQSSSRALAPILKGNGKTLLGMNNTDAFTEAVQLQRKVRAAFCLDCVCVCMCVCMCVCVCAPVCL